jgi:hypothetical protein
MHVYSAFGLCIHSDIELSGFAPGSGDPDITIRQKHLRVVRAGAGETYGDIVSGHMEYEGWDIDLLFRLEEGRRIFYHSLRPIPQETLRSFIQGAYLAATLRQRGLLVLHGSAVSDGDRAIAFLGNSGWGKSTLATYFCDRGYRLITDDVMVVVPGSPSEPARVPPGVKQVRLRPTAAERLVANHESLPLVTPVSPKRLHLLEGEIERALPLSKVYVLQRATAEANRVSAIEKQHVPLHLVAHTHSTNWITEPEHVADHFAQCGRLAQHTPIALLERRMSLDELPAIFDLVQEDLRSLEGDLPSLGEAAQAEPVQAEPVSTELS